MSHLTVYSPNRNINLVYCFYVVSSVCLMCSKDKGLLFLPGLSFVTHQSPLTRSKTENNGDWYCNRTKIIKGGKVDGDGDHIYTYI